MTLTQKNFNTVAGLIFSAVTILHLARLFLGWEAVIAGWSVPIWLSFVALFVAGYLAYSAYQLMK